MDIFIKSKIGLIVSSGEVLLPTEHPRNIGVKISTDLSWSRYIKTIATEVWHHGHQAVLSALKPHAPIAAYIYIL